MHLKNRLGNDFIVGTATSSYQIEGAVDEDGRGPSIWDLFSHTPGKTKSGDTGDIACDHYHRMKEDVALLGWMGVDAYRFSIAWPRVIPEGRGGINEKGLDFYDRLIDALLKEGIAPCATLYHWDLPAALDGGWLNRATVDAFRDYAAHMARRFGDRVAMWFTHNEPWCQAFLGYADGLFAPGHRDFKEALLAAHHLLVSHGAAVEALRGLVGTPIGPALNIMPAYSSSERPEDRAAATRQDGYFNRWFLDPIAGRGYPEDMMTLYGDKMPEVTSRDLDLIAQPIDMLGINYYERCIVSNAVDGILKLRHERRPGPCTADREIYPEGLGDILQRLHSEYRFPRFIITENGAAFSETPNADGYVDDIQRVDFLHRHLEEIVRARASGVPVDGYFAWSLMDNFEWSEGYDMRYGLTHVDFKTQSRTPKASAHFIRALFDEE